MATYTIFAGVNGAGKTSIYKSIYYERNKNEKRINTDEMVARIGSWKDSNLQIKCAREAVKLINYYIKNNISFNQETTLSGKSIVRNIRKAKEKGFYVVMNFIGVDSPEVAKERVRIRVLEGGHGISEEAVERRYYESLENLKILMLVCDETNIYDNTKQIEEIAYLINGAIKWKSKNMPKWSRKILK
ncbi:ATPase [Clostridium tyrobutyricum]|jgi:predicted ABC-type ATPase|uniref:UDP-N-acetylglucosamine kinase n=1 Tax=Clostridium tyrobutyricum DIVETGP TaxID=1408889 RepID=W6N7D9_CLOTY|nr:zeta toxin family protein [Clostridium tyrobutyricum]AND85506.1 ATPase [Clostridium tyrobutyricum]ANP70047.1 ATPase [Clostridium tyrobutyricum]MBV4426542.1 zeta toxin family protein [Clostridium tyrobutyricum]MBV4434388.1 zeta toxin family protein [Clostridium tyrobutyricum]MCH4200481.1 zeta toxin family protein [Clostridium tyrobutyricum]